MRYPLDQMKIRPFQFGAYDPISNTFGKVRKKNTRAHQGWDLLAMPGTPVYAIADGELKFIDEGRTGLGLKAIQKFTHNKSTYFAVYAHLSTALVGASSVKQGAKIAKTGMSGNASWPRPIPVAEAHLHFEIRTQEIIPRSPNHPLAHRVDPGEVFGYTIYSCRTDDYTLLF
jgi:murein DD-endopeptidase MepM/ murein hydrolase activator NlpD